MVNNKASVQHMVVLNLVQNYIKIKQRNKSHDDVYQLPSMLLSNWGSFVDLKYFQSGSNFSGKKKLRKL